MTDAAPAVPPAAPEPSSEGAGAGAVGPQVPPPQVSPTEVPPVAKPRAKRVRAVPVQPEDVRGPTIDVQAVSSPVGAMPPPAPQPLPPASSTPPAPQQESPAAPPPPPASPPPAAAPTAPAQPPRRWWTALCHLAYLIPFHLPGIIVTAAVWMWRRGRDPQLADQGREALNMQLTFWIVNVVLSLTLIGLPLTPVVWVIGAILSILAAVQAGDGGKHRYPWILRIIA